MFDITEKTIAFIGQKAIPKNFPGTSGIESYVENRMLCLVKKRKKIYSYGRKWATQDQKKEYKGIHIITIFTINTKYLDTLSYSFFASIHASLSDATLVWYQGMGPAIFSIIPRIFGKKIYTTIHSLDWNRKKWSFWGRIFLLISEKITILISDKIFVVSLSLKEYYENKFAITPILDKINTSSKRKVPIRIIANKYNLQKNKYVLYLGRFVPEKRIEWLIRAMEHCKKYSLVLAGGSSHSDDYVEYLKSLSRNKLIIYTGYVFGKEKAELISNCKLFVLPSNLEGYPVAVTEAIGYGKKCLVGDFLKSEYPSSDKKINFFDVNNYENFLSEFTRLIKN